MQFLANYCIKTYFVLKEFSIHSHLKRSYILYLPAAVADVSAASSAPYWNLELNWNIVCFTVIPNMMLS